MTDRQTYTLIRESDITHTHTHKVLDFVKREGMRRPPLWLVVRVPGYRSRGSGFDSQRYQIFWEVVGLERGPFRITEELRERTASVPVYKTEINGRGDSLRWPRDTLYQLKLALTSPTSGGRSVGIVRWRTKPRSEGMRRIPYEKCVPADPTLARISFYFWGRNIWTTPGSLSLEKCHYAFLRMIIKS
jgi:hypothetical protein